MAETVFRSFRFNDNNFKSSESEDDELELSLLALIPAYYRALEDYSVSESMSVDDKEEEMNPQATLTSTTTHINTADDSAIVTESATQPFADLLTAVQRRYEQLPALTSAPSSNALPTQSSAAGGKLQHLALSADSLEMLGFFLEDQQVGGVWPGFYSTRAANWSRDFTTLFDIYPASSSAATGASLAATALQQRQAQLLQQLETSHRISDPKPPQSTSAITGSASNSHHHMRFAALLETEDGEEEEEEGAGGKEEGEIKEEGEVVDDAGDSTTTTTTVPVLPKSLAQRLDEQAFHWIFKHHQPQSTESAETTDAVADDASSLLAKKRTFDQLQSQTSAATTTNNDAPTASTATTKQIHSVTLPLDVVALDCEMCSTADGLELTRLTLVHPMHGIVLDTIVKPRKPIVEYHTEFSGITAEQMEKVSRYG